MSQKPPDFFPSLYDKSSSAPSEDIFNAWKKIWVALKEKSQQKKESELGPAWPPGLADIPYDPLKFFSTAQWRGATPNYVDLGEISDLQFQMKEAELLDIIGEEPDPKSYQLLENVGDKTRCRTDSDQGAKDPAPLANVKSLPESSSAFS
ncbi:uncharacterized protein C11orf91 [Xenopus laevis]|uniref:Uncharacterized protein C11orf91 n=2 Tax=Xenopus laevis TaxID=8355 RepID=A0A1L8GJ44_XENLA|nr:uncharacterized protein C11orf91 [Xenopus laevis]OCT83816.1 hypothetical protein XELAEV_18021955mg [Xenopus laevis]